jgi:hypothetical protein
MLGWALPYHQRTYRLDDKYAILQHVHSLDALHTFALEFDYFSKKHPVISTVTSDPCDVKKGKALLQALVDAELQASFVEFATAEILAKVIAFRSLAEGEKIEVPTIIKGKKAYLASYRVDKVLNLWPGMPAFGLVSEDISLPAILLYRGTDLSLETRQGWASVICDFDLQGPGFTAYQRSKEEIAAWRQSCGRPLRVIGYSLGGVLALYTALFEEGIDTAGSYAFNPPGVTAQTYDYWHSCLHLHMRPMKVFVTRGDIVSKVGLLASEVYEMYTEKKMHPLDAHVRLMCCEKKLYLSRVDVALENRARGGRL